MRNATHQEFLTPLDAHILPTRQKFAKRIRNFVHAYVCYEVERRCTATMKTEGRDRIGAPGEQSQNGRPRLQLGVDHESCDFLCYRLTNNINSTCQQQGMP